MTFPNLIEYVHDDATGLYRRARVESIVTRVVVFGGEAVVSLIRAAVGHCVWVKSHKELIAEAAKPGMVLFVEHDLLCHVDGEGMMPVIGVINESHVSDVIGLLGAFPWLSHFVTTTMLSRPRARAHLTQTIARLTSGIQQYSLGQVGGRLARLACASKRDARFERMRLFFSKRGVSGRTVDRINEVFEELVTNALYDAPLEAGYYKEAVPRTKDVHLPAERACEISYSVDEDTAYVRIRDPFGSLTRARLLAVLSRCNSSAVALDESRGGAGLGLWRVFTLASTLSIVVDPGYLTEIVVGIPMKARGSEKNQLLAIDVVFASSRRHARVSAPADADLIDHSVTLVRVA